MYIKIESIFSVHEWNYNLGETRHTYTINSPNVSRLLYMRIHTSFVIARSYQAFYFDVCRTNARCTRYRNIVGATFDINETPVSATIDGWLVSAR